MQTQQITGGLAVTAIWEAREGEADTVADILARFAPQARQEPGTKMFEAHQQTPHFKALIVGEGVPRLSKRERTQYRML
jgi:quinol monooxygenase YgiN